jgi:hypothetical protein
VTATLPRSPGPVAPYDGSVEVRYTLRALRGLTASNGLTAKSDWVPGSPGQGANGVGPRSPG